MRRIKPELTLAVDAANYLGESMIWSVEERALYWINCEEPAELHRWSPANDVRKRWPLPHRIGGVALMEGGSLLLILADGLYDFDEATGDVRLRIASPMSHANMHESLCDRQGRLWVGGMDRRLEAGGPLPGGASLWRLDGDRLCEMVGGISCSNGLAFSPDGRTLYHSDSPTSQIHAWDVDTATGAISNRRIFVTLQPGEGFCDGATVDAEGGYWMTLVFGGKLRRYRSDGVLDLEVELPFSAPTKVAFGGAELDTLFITTTKLPMGDYDNPLHGGLFAFKPGVRGVAEAALRTPEIAR